MDFLNVIVENGNIRDGDEELVFGPDRHDGCIGCPRCKKEEVMRVPATTTIFDLLVMLGAFPSKGQARKNWQHGAEIPPGFSEFRVGKLRRLLTIWNPTE